MELTRCNICHSDDVRIVYSLKDFSVSSEYFDLAGCKSCGFRFTMDPPSEDSCGKYYKSQDYISHSDTSKGLIFSLYHFVRKIMLGKKSKFIKNLGASKSLLDFGSGTGYFLNFMKQEGYHVAGIELDEEARLYGNTTFGLNVQSPDYIKNGQISEKFGYITLWHVLEHLYTPDQYLRIFHHLLDEDGYLVIAVPNFQSFDANYYKSFWAAYDVPRHLWHFNPSTLKLMADRSGFVLISKKLMPFDSFYNSMLSEKYKGNFLGLLRAGFIGFIALIKGIIDVNEASSIIYVFKKKKIDDPSLK